MFIFLHRNWAFTGLIIRYRVDSLQLAWPIVLLFVHTPAYNSPMALAIMYKDSMQINQYLLQRNFISVSP